MCLLVIKKVACYLFGVKYDADIFVRQHRTFDSDHDFNKGQ